MSEIAELFDALKRLQSSNLKTLRELLQNEYSAEWSSKKIHPKSLSKAISRKLDVLVEMNLVQKERVGKENIYTIVHNFPVQSEAPKLIEQLKDIFKEDKALFIQAQKPMEALINEIKSPYYIRYDSEDLGDKKTVLSKLELAINECYLIDVHYKSKSYKVEALKIAEFEGIWYLLLFYPHDASYRKFRIIDIADVTLLKEKFKKSTTSELKISQWHNVWHDPNREISYVTLLIANEKINYFYQKNIFSINNYPQRVKETPEGVEYIVHITHEAEILSELMYWQPHVIILSEEGSLHIIDKLCTILETMLHKQKEVVLS